MPNSQDGDFQMKTLSYLTSEGFVGQHKHDGKIKLHFHLL